MHTPRHGLLLRRLSDSPFAFLALALALVATPSNSAIAQDDKRSEDVDAIDRQFQTELRALETRRLERLATLAASQKPADAAVTYEVYLQSALVGSLYTEAEPVAEAILGKPNIPLEVRYLAHLVNIIAEVDRGAFDDSLNSVRKAAELAKELRDQSQSRAMRESLPLATRVSLIDHYIHRVVQAGRFDVAQKAIAIKEDAQSPEVLETLNAWQARIALVGKPAPPIKGTDLDGKPFDLAQLKGQVVLVWFWASWCLPNDQEMTEYVAFEKRYRAKGLRVVGINLDSLQTDSPNDSDIRANAVRTLIEHNVPWPNLINGNSPAADFAKAYAVESIPANYLVGREGTIVQLDLVATNAQAEIEKALGK
jgi:thiol-disulfide isomerase/thioredoxin